MSERAGSPHSEHQLTWPAVRRDHWWVLGLLGVLVLAAGLRLYGIGDWPVFMDEDAHTQIALDMTHLGLPKILSRSFALAKPPLAFLLHTALIWLSGPEQALLAGRVLSAAAGVATVALTYLLGRRVGGSGVGLVAALLYACVPVAVLHERMVLQDGLLSAVTLAMVLLGWTALEQGRLRLALGVAALGVAAVLIKVSAILVVAPLGLVWLTRRAAWRRWPLLALMGAAPVAVYVALRLSPVGPALALQDTQSIRPLAGLSQNLATVGDAAQAYLGVPALVLLGLAVPLLAWRCPWELVVLGGGALAWVAPWVLFSQFAPSRYCLPAVPYLCALVALGLSQVTAAVPRVRLGSSWAGLLVGPLLAAGWAMAAWQADRDLGVATLPRLDDSQYRSDWPAGYGYQAAAAYLRGAAEPGASVVYAVDDQHYVGAALQVPVVAGVRVMGPVSPTDVLPVPSGGPLYVMVDDYRGEASDERPNQVKAANAGLVWVEVGRFYKLHSPLSVRVLRGVPSQVGGD